MKTQFRGNGECLDVNQSTSTTNEGAAVFMNACRNVSSQLWTVEDAGSGWYVLTTQLPGGEQCLYGNLPDSPVNRGAAFLSTCQKDLPVPFWKFVPEGNAYRLKAQANGDGKCLEGNQSTSSVHEGNAFMDKCQNVSDQLWVLENVVGANDSSDTDSGSDTDNNADADSD